MQPMSRPVMKPDSRVPALIVKIGQYPLHSGGVGAIRTLGRLGVPVYATTEDPFTPAALSRYCTGRFRWRTTGREDPEELIGGPARHRATHLGDDQSPFPWTTRLRSSSRSTQTNCPSTFSSRQIPSGLPRQLASKHELYRLCRQHGVPAPESVFLSTAAEVAAFAAAGTFPVVAKNAEPWVRRRAPVVAGTTVLRTASELLALTEDRARNRAWSSRTTSRPEHAEDWIVHLYCDANSNCLVLFTGVKVRSWPPHTGATACAYAVPNPALAQMTERFCKEIGFQGVADLDLRFDRRDGQFKLVDFNPRMGNQFRLFETAAGIDVVRALYLDLTGRIVPASHQVNGRRIVVEHIDLLAQARLPRQHLFHPIRSAGRRDRRSWPGLRATIRFRSSR